MSLLERRGEQRSPKGFTIKSRRVPSTVAHISGLALAAISPGLLVSAIIEFATGGSGGWALLGCSILFAIVGSAAWFGTRLGDLTARVVFAAVAWSWVLVSIAGALPFILARTFAADGISRWVEMSDAIFESTSGYTCTGSTVLTNLPNLGENSPEVGKGILFYRQLTQWYGGMGFVQLVVAVLPALGAKALGFMSAEAPGPTADRLSSRAVDTASMLWKTYAGFTGTVALGYWIAGMSVFEAVSHSLTTASTGGFSIYNDSLGEFDSLAIEIVAIIAMIFGGANFALHWLFLTRDRSVYGRDHEFRAYIAMLVVSIVAITSMLTANDTVGGFWAALRATVFNVVSLGTSTGFGNAQGPGTPGDIVLWGASPLVILLLLMTVGGMTGSTAGGTKVFRVRVVFALAHRMLVRVRQPRSVVPLRLGREVIKEDISSQIAVFYMAYLALVVGGILAVTALGGDLEESVSGVIGSLGNMGPSFGKGGPTATFQNAFPTPARLVLAFLMLVGRLELFTVLLMLAAPRRALRRIRPHRRVG